MSASPPIRIQTSDRGIAHVDLSAPTPTPPPTGEGRRPLKRICERELREYFAGKRRTFSSRLDLQGTTFQRAVWDAIAQIPYGETRTYKDIAVAIGRPKAVRAVGQAVGANPLAILIPCHRVVASPRAKSPLGGFAWGAAWKKKLLALEQAAIS